MPSTDANFSHINITRNIIVRGNTKLLDEATGRLNTSLLTPSLESNNLFPNTDIISDRLANIESDLKTQQLTLGDLNTLWDTVSVSNNANINADNLTEYLFTQSQLLNNLKLTITGDIQNSIMSIKSTLGELNTLWDMVSIYDINNSIVTVDNLTKYLFTQSQLLNNLRLTVTGDIHDSLMGIESNLGDISQLWNMHDSKENDLTKYLSQFKNIVATNSNSIFHLQGNLGDLQELWIDSDKVTPMNLTKYLQGLDTTVLQGNVTKLESDVANNSTDISRIQGNVSEIRNSLGDLQALWSYKDNGNLTYYLQTLDNAVLQSNVANLESDVAKNSTHILQTQGNLGDLRALWSYSDNGNLTYYLQTLDNAVLQSNVANLESDVIFNSNNISQIQGNVSEIRNSLGDLQALWSYKDNGNLTYYLQTLDNAVLQSNVTNLESDVIFNSNNISQIQGNVSEIRNSLGDLQELWIDNGNVTTMNLTQYLRGLDTTVLQSNVENLESDVIFNSNNISQIQGNLGDLRALWSYSDNGNLTNYLQTLDNAVLQSNVANLETAVADNSTHILQTQGNVSEIRNSLGDLQELWPYSDNGNLTYYLQTLDNAVLQSNVTNLESDVIFNSNNISQIQGNVSEIRNSLGDLQELWIDNGNVTTMNLTQYLRGLDTTVLQSNVENLESVVEINSNNILQIQGNVSEIRNSLGDLQELWPYSDNGNLTNYLQTLDNAVLQSNVANLETAVAKNSTHIYQIQSNFGNLESDVELNSSKILQLGNLGDYLGTQIQGDLVELLQNIMSRLAALENPATNGEPFTVQLIVTSSSVAFTLQGMPNDLTGTIGLQIAITNDNIPILMMYRDIPDPQSMFYLRTLYRVARIRTPSATSTP
jgi:hypothetical protein